MDTTQTAQSVTSIVNTIDKAGVKPVLFALLTLVIGFIIVKVILKFLGKWLGKIRKNSPVAYTLINAAVKFLLYFIVLASAAGVLGISMTTVVAVFSVIGLAVSLSVQNLLSSFAGGIILLITAPFKEGDFIETNEVSGTVREVSFMMTRIDTPDGKRVIIPNSLMFATRVTNCFSTPTIRVEIPVSAHYDNHPRDVIAACRLAVSRCPKALEDPAPIAYVDSYGDSAINYIIRVWCMDRDYYDVKMDVTEQLYDAFNEKGIIMTYPHINVHMDEAKS